MSDLTLTQLANIASSCPVPKLEIYLPFLNEAMAEGEINTPLRQSMFLAQLLHESGDFKWMEEIASGAAYEGRKDLGNTHTGDGKRFKGRGPIQLTGRANYKAAGDALGVDFINSPEIAAFPEYGFRTAVWFWGTRNLNVPSDAGDIKTVTKKINGGFNGLEDRKARYAKAKKVLGV